MKDIGPELGRTLRDLIFFSFVLGWVFLCCRCAPIQPPLPAPAVDIYSRGEPVCTGVRIAPTLMATARHCLEQHAQLTVGGTPVVKVASASSDVALLRVPAGDYVRAWEYQGEAFVKVSSFAGERIAHVDRASPATGLTLDGPCVKGESGSPVTTNRGVVAVVTNGGPTTCYAQWVTR